MNYEVLYYFMNENFNVVEVKKTNLPSDSTPDKLYHWLFIPTSNNLVRKLHFIKMGEETVNGNLIQIREFDNAELRFDQTFAKFQLEGNGHILMKSDLSKLTPALLKSIENYLS